MPPMEAVSAAAPRVRPAPNRARLLDVALVAGIVLLALVLDVHSEGERAGIGSGLLGLLVGAPLLWRRSQPLPVFGVVAVVVLFVASTIPYPCIVAALVAGYSLAVYSRHWKLSLALMVALAAGVDIIFPGPLPRIPNATGPFLLLLFPWIAGNAMRLRQQRIDSVESRAMRLERERDEAEAALRSERTRIARELHDVVAHSVSVMVVQAGAARQVVRSKPDRATEALLAVEECGREAMGELRHLLGLLTEPGSIPLAPQPGLDGVPLLVDRIRAAGLPVSLLVEGATRHLPPGVGLAAYRIVQEALTNALKHSGAATSVVVRYGDNVLELSIVDEGPVSTGQARDDWALSEGTGQGLMGMRERVALYGGSLEAGPRPGGGYAVHARIPTGGGLGA
jgi:signal transduction histidine kinase